MVRGHRFSGRFPLFSGPSTRCDVLSPLRRVKFLEATLFCWSLISLCTVYARRLVV